jgi:hypothetical protein
MISIIKLTFIIHYIQVSYSKKCVRKNRLFYYKFIFKHAGAFYDTRSVECSKYNTFKYKGKFHHWKPFWNGLHLVLFIFIFS